MFLRRSAVVKQAALQAEAITRYALNFSSSFGYPLDITFVSSHVHSMTILSLSLSSGDMGPIFRMLKLPRGFLKLW
jgi:hypothetical protein